MGNTGKSKFSHGVIPAKWKILNELLPKNFFLQKYEQFSIQTCNNKFSEKLTTILYLFSKTKALYAFPFFSIFSKPKASCAVDVSLEYLFKFITYSKATQNMNYASSTPESSSHSMCYRHNVRTSYNAINILAAILKHINYNNLIQIGAPGSMGYYTDYSCSTEFEQRQTLKIPVRQYLLSHYFTFKKHTTKKYTLSFVKKSQMGMRHFFLVKIQFPKVTFK